MTDSVSIPASPADAGNPASSADDEVQDLTRVSRDRPPSTQRGGRKFSPALAERSVFYKAVIIEVPISGAVHLLGKGEVDAKTSDVRSCNVTAVAGLAASAAPAWAQGAIVFRLGPEGGCEVGPTDIPGIPVDIPANCLSVATPSGNAMILVRAEIPAGFALSETFLAQDVPCFFPGLGPGNGGIVATPGGQITAQCFIQA